MTIRSTGRLATALAVGLGGIVAAVIAGLAEVAILAAPWFIAAVVALGNGLDRTPRVKSTVGSNRVMTGDTVDLTISITADRSCFVHVEPRPLQRFRDRPAAAPPPPVTIELVRAGHLHRVHAELQLGEWGTWDLGRSSISFEDPLGFLRLDGAIQADHEVRVHPPTERLRTLARPHAVRRVTGVHPSRVSGRGIEYADIRRYQPGDALRDINWRASARSQDLQVAERHPDRGADVLLLLDSFVESGHDLDRVLGMAVRACLAIAEGHLGVTDRVGLIEFGGVVRWVEPGTGGVQLHRLTDALLASSLFSNAAAKELPTLAPRIWSPRAVVVALTPLLDARFVEAIVAARSRGHDVAVVECRPFDARAADPAGSEPADTDSIGLALWEAERVRGRDRLSEHGIAVVDWAPDQPVELALSQLARRRDRPQVRAR